MLESAAYIMLLDVTVRIYTAHLTQCHKDCVAKIFGRYIYAGIRYTWSSVPLCKMSILFDLSYYWAVMGMRQTTIPFTGSTLDILCILVSL